MAIKDVSFEVDGLPPAKSEASSILGASHPHNVRVALLLTGAQRAIVDLDFKPFSEPIGLAVTLRAPTGTVLSDATNYLGGIADVLQDKGHVANHHTIHIDHPDELMLIALFHDDRQIQEVHYHRERTTPIGYSVHVWLLE